jgi:hypothetical protein
MAAWRGPDCRAGRLPRWRELMPVVPGTSSAKTRFALLPGHDDPLLEPYSRVSRSRNALPTTLTDDSAIAAAAMIGDSSRPNAG